MEVDDDSIPRIVIGPNSAPLWWMLTPLRWPPLTETRARPAARSCHRARSSGDRPEIVLHDLSGTLAPLHMHMPMPPCPDRAAGGGCEGRRGSARSPSIRRPWRASSRGRCRPTSPTPTSSRSSTTSSLLPSLASRASSSPQPSWRWEAEAGRASRDPHTAAHTPRPTHRDPHTAHRDPPTARARLTAESSPHRALTPSPPSRPPHARAVALAAQVRRLAAQPDSALGAHARVASQASADGPRAEPQHPAALPRLVLLSPGRAPPLHAPARLAPAQRQLVLLACELVGALYAVGYRRAGRVRRAAHGSVRRSLQVRMAGAAANSSNPHPAPPALLDAAEPSAAQPSRTRC